MPSISNTSLIASRRPRAFTLIELLVVITIVGILAGMLMTVLGRVRARALSIRCVSNLRQLGMAARMYSDDNQDYVPVDKVVSGSDNPTWAEVSAAQNRNVWFNALPLYVQSEPLYNTASTPAQFYPSYGILQCPAAKWSGNEASAAGPRFSYAYNSKLTTSEHVKVTRKELEDSNLETGGANVNNRAVTQSTVPLFCDTRCSTSESRVFTSQNDSKVGSPHTYTTRLSERHFKRVNIVFFDGHVNSYEAKSLMDSSGKNTTTSPVIWKPWNPDEQ